MFEVRMCWKWLCKWRCCGTLEEIPAQSTARLCARTYHWMRMRWDCAMICCWEERLTCREDHVMAEIMSQERHNCVPLLCVSSKKLKPLLIGECVWPVCFKIVPLLPYKYANNYKVWVVMKMWLDLNITDARIDSTARKGILLVGKCATYPPDTLLLGMFRLSSYPGVCTTDTREGKDRREPHQGSNTVLCNINSIFYNKYQK
jgi:hypothetical protein